ncbi:MAG: hypothetical protein IKR09_06585 [Alphaproteobacteria bacterium]|nr:hypothetical protein [Alphaproteobacteria bacterium]
MIRKIIFVFSLLLSSAVRAQDMPPKCWEPYLYVQSYGEWSLNGGIWSLPFVCSSGVGGTVRIAEQNVMNLGYAEYYIHAQGVENGNTFFYTEPCGAMGKFCQYVSLPKEQGIPTLYSLGYEEQKPAD